MQQKLISKRVSFLLQNATFLLKNAIVLKKCIDFVIKYDSYYKMCWYSTSKLED